MALGKRRRRRAAIALAVCTRSRKNYSGETGVVLAISNVGSLITPGKSCVLVVQNDFYRLRSLSARSVGYRRRRLTGAKRYGGGWGPAVAHALAYRNISCGCN